MLLYLVIMASNISLGSCCFPYLNFGRFVDLFHSFTKSSQVSAWFVGRACNILLNITYQSSKGDKEQKILFLSHYTFDHIARHYISFQYCILISANQAMQFNQFLTTRAILHSLPFISLKYECYAIHWTCHKKRYQT